MLYFLLKRQKPKPVESPLSYTSSRVEPIINHKENNVPMPTPSKVDTIINHEENIVSKPSRVASGTGNGTDFIGDEKGHIWPVQDRPKVKEKMLKVEDLLPIIQAELAKRGMYYYTTGSSDAKFTYDHLRVVYSKKEAGKWKVTAAFMNRLGIINSYTTSLVIDENTLEVTEMNTQLSNS